MIWQIIVLVTLAAAAFGEALTRVLRATAGASAPSRAAIFAVVLAVEAAVLVAMLERRAPLFGRVFWKGRPAGRTVAITFDDGPTEPYTSRILDILRDRGVRATFFVLGRRAEALPEIVARAAAEGHDVGNHGYDHSVLPLRGPSFVRRQIERTSFIIDMACGRRPTLFRASHGWRNPWVTREAARAGCSTIGWTLGVWDTDRPGADVICRRVIRGVRPGCILLLHDGRGLEPDPDAGQVVDALPGILDALEADGYRFLTVTQMMRESSRGTR